MPAQANEALLNVEFTEECHGDGPIHLNTTFGEWNTPGFLMSLWPNPRARRPQVTDPSGNQA